MEWARMIRDHARDADAVIVANAMFMPALEVSGARVPMIWDTNECQTLHYERLERTVSNRTKQVIWWGLERWAARRCRVAVAIGQAEAAEWRRIHAPLRGKLMTVDHAAFVPERTTEAGDRDLVERVGGLLHRPILLFVGTIAAKHNAVAARWLIDVLAPTLPETTTIVICGPGSDGLIGGGKAGARVVLLGAVDDVELDHRHRGPVPRPAGHRRGSKDEGPPLSRPRQENRRDAHRLRGPERRARSARGAA